MTQAMVNFRLDDKIKRNMEKTCKAMGLSLTAAFTIFAIKVAREKRIPFEISEDPFYSQVNMARLKKAIQEVESGRTKLTPHELIEDANDKKIVR